MKFSGRAYGLGVLGMAALLAATPALSPRAAAQDAGQQQQQQSKDRLSLTVRGKATAMADEVCIDLTISASAEESGEAEKKYRDKLARVLNALGKGDGKTPVDDDAPKKRKKKPAADDDAPAVKKKKPAADDEEEAAPKPKKKKPAADEDEEAPKPKKKKPAIDDEDDEDAPKKKPEPKKEDAEPKKEEPKKEEGKKDEKKPEEAKAEEFPFEVKEGGLTFGVKGGDANAQMRRRMMGQQAAKEEPEFRFSSTLSILFHKVSKADPKALRKRIAEVLDKVSDAGVDTAVSAEGEGSPPVVRFSVGEPEELKVRAYTAAMGAARTRGQNLSNLAERSLGKVCAVRDQTALPQTQHKQAYNPYQYGYQVTTQIGEDWSTDVIMEVDLYVEFELRDKATEKK